MANSNADTFQIVLPLNLVNLGKYLNSQNTELKFEAFAL